MTESEKKLFGILGYPLGHSLSPILHEFLLKRIGLRGCYHLFEVKKENLGLALQGLKTLEFTGFNVTIPYKQLVVSYLDEVFDDAKIIGAVNTVLVRNDKLYGYNTDGIGLVRAFKYNSIKIQGKSAVVLGAGGAARSVVLALVNHGIKKVWVLNRTLHRAELLAKDISTSTGFTNIFFNKLVVDNVTKALESSELLINATSIGMWPDIESMPYSFNYPTPYLTVIDLVYNPLRTKFLKAANMAGAKTLDGLDMLIYQGVEAMQIWTGIKISVENFFNELKSKLTQKLKEYGKH